MKHYSIAMMRRGALAFLAGRCASGLLGLANFTLLARTLDVGNYASYVGLVAALELAIAFSAFGIDWVGLRYIPECREHAHPKQFARFVNGLLLARAAVAAVLALVLYALARVLLPWLELERFAFVVALYVAVMLTSESVWRFVCGVVFDSLLMQGYSQFVQIARSGAITLALLVWVSADPTLQLRQVVIADCAASSLACVCSLALYLRARRADRRRVDAAATLSEWRAPERRRLWSTAWHNYSTTVVSHAYSPTTMQLIVNATLAPASAAAFGFARTFVDLIRRYLPSEFFTSLFRPMLLARYARTRDFTALNRGVMSAYKVSLLVLVPLILVLLTLGTDLLALVSAGKYQHAYPLVLVLLFVTASWMHRRMLALVVNAVDAMKLWSGAAIACLLVVPVAILAAQTPMGVYGVLAAMALEELLSSVLVVRGLRKRGMAYRFDVKFFCKTLIAAASAYAAFATFGREGVYADALRAAGALAGFAVVMYWWRPFDATEIPVFRRLVSFGRG